MILGNVKVSSMGMLKSPYKDLMIRVTFALSLALWRSVAEDAESESRRLTLQSDLPKGD